MADKPNPKPAPELVEVRLLAPQFRQVTDAGEVLHKRGDVFLLDKRAYDRDVVPMGLQPPRSRSFQLTSEIKKADTTKANAAKATQDRIAGIRASVADREKSSDDARLRARVQEAENARQLVEAMKPMERPGAHRVG